MEYNNYYSTQPGPPPMMPGANMMHPSPLPIPPPQQQQQQVVRQVVTPVPPGHQQQQMQQQQPQQQLGPPPHQQLGPHHIPQQPMTPQQHHPNYHQMPQHQPLPPHSASPHPHLGPLPSLHHNHQTPPNMNLQPPPRPSTGPSPMHPQSQQSPHHMGGPPMHIQQQPPHAPPQQQQQLNQMGGPPNGPPPQQQSPAGQLLPPPPGGIATSQAHPHHPNHQGFMSPSPGNPMGPGAGPIPQHYSQSHHQHQGGQPPLPPPSHLQQQPLPPPPAPQQQHQPGPLPPQQQHQPGPPPPQPLPPTHNQQGPLHHPHPHHHHQGPPPPSQMQHHHPHPHHHQGPQMSHPPGYSMPPQPIERGSPFYQNIPQTEFRIIELNKRLQTRPRFKLCTSPLPLIGASEESFWWEKFACDFFDDDATLSLRIIIDDKPVEYTIGRTLIPKFFRSYFEGGVVDLSIKLRNTREIPHGPHLITLECDQTDIITKNKLKHSAMNLVVHTEGQLNLEFVSNSYDILLIKSWRFYTTQCHEYIDRSMTTTGAFLVEPVTRHGLTKSTIAFLKMCMIMEPMQDLMLLHSQTKMDPRSCLKHLLFDKYKHKNVEDNRAQPNKRRRKKAPATTGAGSAGGNTKKGKANNNANNANNAMNNSNNLGFNNIEQSNLISPSTVGGGACGMPNLSLASQDVMVVGEPSMLGADFGDENERKIIRMENNQFDSSVEHNNISQSQMCNSINNQNPNQTNHMQRQQQQPPPQQQQQQQQQQQNNHETGTNVQMMSHTNNNNGNNGTSDPNGNSNHGNNCLQTANNNNNNNHQMSIIMNGNVNHLSHMTKSELDLKQPTAAPPTVTDSEAR